MVYVIKLVALVLTLSSIFATPKKGFGLTEYRCGDTYTLSDTTWWYNWYYQFGENSKLNCSRPTRGEYVPMIWGEEQLKSAIIPHDAKYVLAFNEPRWQSKISPERAAELWPQVEQKAGNRTLVSPALTGCDMSLSKCFDWFDRFFSACKHCRVDRMAMHGYNCVPLELMEALRMISSRYNRPIWLTEFSCKGNVTVEQDVEFMQQVVPMLEKAAFVERYAWFSSRYTIPTPYMVNNSTSLLERNSTELSRLGKLYNSLNY